MKGTISVLEELFGFFELLFGGPHLWLDPCPPFSLGYLSCGICLIRFVFFVFCFSLCILFCFSSLPRFLLCRSLRFPLCLSCFSSFFIGPFHLLFFAVRHPLSILLRLSR